MVLAASGVQVLRPESLPLVEQLRNYRAATNVVMAEGSALHALQLVGRIDADVAVLERRPGTRLAQANVAPRVRSLTYDEVSTKLVHGILPTGRPALPKGLSVADPERLIEAFDRRGVDLRPAWNDGDWVEGCNALVEHFDGRMEILNWPQEIAARDGQSDPRVHNEQTELEAA